LAEVKNNTEYTVSGVIEYVSCRDDRFKVGPGKKWTAKRRGVCLISKIKGSLRGIPVSLKGTGKTSFGESQTVVPYKSSIGTSYSRFQINAYGDRYQIFSEDEWAKEKQTDPGMSPGFRLVNKTEWPVAYSLDQIGCLYHGIVPARFKSKDGIAIRKTGSAWFTLRAHIQADGKDPQSALECAEPIAEIVGEVFLAALTIL
jgi:hypothetical protein